MSLIGNNECTTAGNRGCHQGQGPDLICCDNLSLSPPPTCGRDDVAVVVAVVGQLEAAGQREVLGQLDRVDLLPLVDQVVRRPTVWKMRGTK